VEKNPPGKTTPREKNPPFGKVGKQTCEKSPHNLPHEFCILIALINLIFPREGRSQ
jgi:hypothetical protein